MLQCDKTRRAFEKHGSCFLRFSSVRSVLSYCNTWLRLLHLLYDAEVTWRKTVERAFSVLYSDKTWVLDQSECVQGPIYIITEMNHN